VCGDASSSDYAWNVNFNNGNSDWNNVNNKAFVRAVRAPSECQGSPGVSLRDLHQAWKVARRNKRASGNQLAFESNWIDELLDLQKQLTDGTWSPRPTTCFIAQRPKARQIHAPDFADRVVHHWLVPQLEAIYEPAFIHDSYASRRGKGTHKAVDRLHDFMHEVHSGQGGGWYLQLDIANFFNSIHRPTLWSMLKKRLERSALADVALRASHALLRHPVKAQGVIHRSTADERARVPMHKRLENAAPGCGLPIGNLSSQFFANVYLDQLDQFVKHTLKAKRYLRFVDDFVLVHRDRAVLEEWKEQIEAFLERELRLKLKDDVRLRPLSVGIDFLGYIVYPTHRRVRRRVLHHAHEALRAWHAAHVRDGKAWASPADLRQLNAVWASYTGHLAHASTYRLVQRMLARQPWLASLTSTKRRFSHQLEGRRITIKVKR
jgi:hypothetical protein